MSDAAAIANLHEVFAIQKAAFLKEQNPSLAVRIGNLHKIAGMLMSNRERIRQAMDKDFGSHPDGASDLIETLGPAGRAMYCATQLEEWLKDESRYLDPALFGEATAVVHREAKGVIGNLVPFNFPIDLSVGPLVEMLAGGNRVIIKPSEFTPACATLLKTMLNATFPRDLVEVVIGGVDLGVEFSTLKWDHLLYTGSPAVGKLVMAAAAKNLVPVTLELGGKCPVVCLPGSITERNIDQILGTKLIKNGQMCVTTDFILVARSEQAEFVKLSMAYMAKLGGYSTSKDCTGIITDRHMKRIVGLLDEAKAAGANVIALEPNGVVDPITRRMPLSLVLDPAPSLGISKEEIFGPILPVLAYDDIDEAIAHINAGERPLALYIFGDDEKAIDHVIDNTKAGGTSVNACALQAALPSLGFGGIGNSGMGRHHGKEGFLEFTNPRGVVRRGTKPDLTGAFAPPYAVGVAVADHAFAEAAKAAGAA